MLLSSHSCFYDDGLPTINVIGRMEACACRNKCIKYINLELIKFCYCHDMLLLSVCNASLFDKMNKDKIVRFPLKNGEISLLQHGKFVGKI